MAEGIVRDGRGNRPYAMVHRSEVVHEAAEGLTGTAWRVLMLLGTYTSGNPDGWVMSEERLAAQLGLDASAVSRAMRNMRDCGYLGITYRFLPRRGTDGSMKPGMQLASLYELRDPCNRYTSGGPDDVTMLIVDSRDPTPGAFRVLRKLHHKRVPNPRTAEERQYGVSVAEVQARGLHVAATTGQVFETPEEARACDERWTARRARVGEVLARQVSGRITEADELVAIVAEVLDQMDEEAVAASTAARARVRIDELRIDGPGRCEAAPADLAAWACDVLEIDPDEAATWFRGAEVTIDDDGALRCVVGSEYYVEWIRMNYASGLSEVGFPIVFTNTAPTNQDAAPTSAWDRAAEPRIDEVFFARVAERVRSRKPEVSLRRHAIGKALRRAVEVRYAV